MGRGGGVEPATAMTPDPMLTPPRTPQVRCHDHHHHHHCRHHGRWLAETATADCQHAATAAAAPCERPPTATAGCRRRHRAPTDHHTTPGRFPHDERRRVR